MKVSPKNYALALSQLVEGKNQSETDELLSNFAKLLIRENQSKNLNKILEKFEDIWNEENNLVKGKIASARKLEESSKQAVVNFIKNKFNCQQVEITEKIDESLIGGFVLRIKDEIMDTSIKTSLRKLKHDLAS